MTPIQGATLDVDGTHFVVWAKGRRSIQVQIEGHETIELLPDEEGYFRGYATGVGHGSRYRYRIDGGDLLPDLASRCQPDGNSGWSVVQSADHDWTDQHWRGPGHFDHLIYELHIGTFTPEGTWQSAGQRLDHLKDLGVTIIHVMPVGTFEGKFGWGYDTTLPYAPFAPYGTPEQMRDFVDQAHARGIGVILDVVYNHVGVGGHYDEYSSHYLTDRHETEWGKTFNFDGPHSGPVRDFIAGNAGYWVKDFHIDGLRLDATQAIFDNSDRHILADIVAATRDAACPRSVFIIAENHRQDGKLVRHPSAGGYGLDALVSDDFQHSARVASTDHNEFYYRDYLGTPQELVSALKYGFLYQGQRSDMRERVYGTANLDTPADRIVHFLENHDQVANSALGLRMGGLMSPSRRRAMTALLLLGPQTPCLFQGQEFGSSKPFHYFLGVEGDIAEEVADGRRKSLSNFPSVLDPAMVERLPEPSDPETLRTSTLDWSEVEDNGPLLALHRDLVQLRRTHRAFSQRQRRRLDGAVIGDGAFLIRYLTDNDEDQRLLMFNLGRDLNVGVVAEPLLAPPADKKWVVAWSSEHPDYGGGGRRPLDTDEFFVLPADTAILFMPEARA